MRVVRVVIAAAAMSLLAACVADEPVKEPPPAPKPEEVEAPPPPPPKPQPRPPSPEVLRMMEHDGIFSDFERLRRLPVAELVREQESARQAFNQMRTDGARVRYAMVLAAPGTSGAENTALEVLDPLLKN